MNYYFIHGYGRVWQNTYFAVWVTMTLLTSSAEYTIQCICIRLFGWPPPLQTSDEVKSNNSFSVIFAVVLTYREFWIEASVWHTAQNNTMDGSTHKRISTTAGRRQVGWRQRRYFQAIFKPEMKADIFHSVGLCDNSKYFGRQRGCPLSLN